MATPNNINITPKSTPDELKQVIGQTTGTAQEVTKIIKQYKDWEDTQTRIVEQTEKYLQNLIDTGKNLKNIGDEDLKKILDRANAIEEIVYGIGNAAGSLKDLAADLGRQLSTVLHDSDRTGNFTKEWNKHLNRSIDFVSQIEASISQGEPISNRQIDREIRRAAQLKEQQRLLLESYGLSGDKVSLEQKRLDLLQEEARIQSRINSEGKSNTLVKQLDDVRNKLSAIGSMNLADRLEAVTQNRKIEERSARKLGRAGSVPANILAGLSGKLGFSNLSEDIGSLVSDYEKSIRLKQSAALTKELRDKKAVEIDGKYYKLDENDDIQEVNIEDYLANIRSSLHFTSELDTLWKGIGKSIFSIGTILIVTGKLWNSFKEVDRVAADIKHTIGDGWRLGITTTNTGLASSVDWLKTAANLTNELSGINAIAVFDEKDIARGAELKNTLGLSDKQLANITTRSKVLGQNADQYLKSVTAGYRAGQASHASAVSLGKVQQEVLNVSNATSLSYAHNAKSLAEAAKAAADLGLNLSDVERISDTLINFETSIESEMKAQLLTGHQLNLSKARELALNNDLGGVAKEIARQGMTASKFAGMNRIKQESMAKALGMSREELAKALILDQIRLGTSTKALAAMYKMDEKQLEAMAATDKWNKAVEKLKQSFSLILQPLATIVGWLADFVAWMAGSTVGKVLGGILGTLLVGGTILRGIPKLIHRITAAATGSIASIKSLGKALKGLRGGTAAGAGGATDLAGQAANVSAGASGATGGMSGFTKGMNAFSGLPWGKLAAAAGILLALGGAIWMMGKGLSLVAQVPWQNILAMFGGLSVALLALGLTMKVVGTIMADPLALGGMLAFAGVLVALGGAAALLGLGLKLATPAIEAFGKILSTLTLEKAIAVVALGRGLVLLGAGLVAFSISSVAAIPALFIVNKLASAVDTLATSMETIGKADFSSLKVLKENLTGLKVPEMDNLKPLIKLANKANSLTLVTNSVKLLADSVEKLGTSLAVLDTSKLSELRAPRLRDTAISNSKRQLETAYSDSVQSKSSEKLVETVVAISDKTIGSKLEEIKKYLGEGIILKDPAYAHIGNMIPADSSTLG